MIKLLLFLLLASHPVRHHKYVLAGSRESMFKQNQEINILNLPRIVDDSQLNQLIKQGELVRIPENETVYLAISTENRKFVRPWVKTFILSMAGIFYNTFNKPLIIDSAVRTVEQQHKLRRINKYAAPAYGEISSSHLAGITVDIAKRKYSIKERKWIVNYLLNLKDKGLIEPTEEPYCYHVMIKEKYNELY